jgi:hypothetical protein
MRFGSGDLVADFLNGVNVTETGRYRAASTPFPIGNRDSFVFKAELIAIVSFQDLNYPNGYDFFGLANLSNTAILEAFQIVDADGNLIPGITMTSDFPYPLDPRNAATVPQPTTLALLAVGAGGLAFARRVRNRR